MTAVLALDIGGTTFAAAVVDATGAVLARRELPVGPDPTATLGVLVRELAVPGLTGAGIGSAGPVDPVRGTVSPVNIPAWRGFPLTATVSGLLGGLPVALAGDAQCMALGEWWRGARGEDTRVLLGVVVSTGVGGGLVVDGVPYLGPTGNAGHIGHMPSPALPGDAGAEPCPCGGTGCVETIASGTSMARWALAGGWRPAPGVGRDARALAASARAGDPVAVAAFDRAARALAGALLSAAALCDVDRVVIGGGVAAAGETLLGPLRRAVAAGAGMGFLRRLTVEPTALGRDAGLYGAAALALNPPAALTREESLPLHPLDAF
ncbi:ROK family protein [Planobispora rosea]|uniref:ROK family protein n=1 Tax=Planobispora rosea TaxID=35762 RepID=UPI00083B5024|nr:ROK family protein [Planobispora rosea]